MPRKIENRAFVMNQLRWIAGHKKTPIAMKIRCLDRLAVMENFYPIGLSDYYGPSAGREMPEVKEDIDEKVSKMLKQVKED